MARHKKYNPEKSAWRGGSGGRVRVLRDAQKTVKEQS
jgi:hypothetical protein